MITFTSGRRTKRWPTILSSGPFAGREADFEYEESQNASSRVAYSLIADSLTNRYPTYHFSYQEHLDLASWVLETNHHNCSHFVTSCKLDSRWLEVGDVVRSEQLLTGKPEAMTSIRDYKYAARAENKGIRSIGYTHF